MRLLVLKELFASGVLAKAHVEPAPDDGWVLRVTKCEGEVLTVTLAAEAGEPKRYARQTAALMDAHRIGFRDVTIKLPEEFVREDGAKLGQTR
ncbi:hypothetical protein QEM33_004621 [Pseudomonas putida]|nr:hypothetical protein [Pseudomonas putida]